MSSAKKLLGAAIGALLMGSVSAAADTIKVGVIGPFSGPFALQGKNFQAGVEAYMALNGKTVERPHGRGGLPRPSGGRTRPSPALWRRSWSSRTRCSIWAASISPRCHGDHAAPQAGQCAAGHLQRRDLGDHDPVASGGAHVLHHGQTTTPLGKIAVDRGAKKIISVVSDYGPGRRCGGRVQEGLRGSRRAGRRSHPHAAQHQRFQPDHAARASVPAPRACSPSCRPGRPRSAS